MGRDQQARWSLKWCSFFASVAFLGLAGVGNGSNAETGYVSEPTETNNKKWHCNNHASGPRTGERNFLLVSTMDGKVSALNLEKEGQMEWEVDAGQTPLLSSSISELQVMRNNVPTRLIPSLDGTLFQFDGENEIMEALPFTADTLLSSSFKLNQDSTIVGGKKSVVYGVELQTGKIRYICTADGCTEFEGGVTTESEDVIVLKRHTKTVRAVEMRTGVEKWNFSVGEHDVALLPRPQDVPHLTAGERVEGDDDSTVHSCPPDSYVDEEEEDWLEYLRSSLFAEQEAAIHDLDLKVIVPQGLVIAMSKSQPDRVMWKYKFPTAIANAWLVQDQEVSEVSLFNDKVVPALVEEDPAGGQEAGLTSEPLVYIGTYENQFYVQQSVLLKDELHDRMVSASANNVVADMPRIRWHPYIATAPSRTPVVAHYNPLQIGFEQDAPRDEHGGLTVWQNQYPFDSGWYLMADTSPIKKGPLVKNVDNTTSIYNNLTISLNWREMIAVTVLTSVVVHLILVRCFPKRFYSYDVSTSSAESLIEHPTTSKEAPPVSPSPNDTSVSQLAGSPPPEYVSRFATEFEPKQCLGKGGFGVVFESLNRMDDCTYAIKRISLTNSDRAREKVMREVKALAKLEHVGIVRYYQAWFENPPVGWQDKQDSTVLEMPSTTPTPADNTTGQPPRDLPRRPTATVSPSLRTEPHLEFTSRVRREGRTRSNDALLGGGDTANPLKVFGGLDRWSNSNDSLSGFSASCSEEKKKGGSEGFLPRLGSSGGTGLVEAESESFSGPMLKPRHPLIEDSLSIEFRNSEESSNLTRSASGAVPFGDYDRSGLPEEDTNDSFNIVFEDSGCAVKGTNDNAFLDNENSIDADKTQNTGCTDLEAERSLSRSPTKQSSPARSQRPSSLALVSGQSGCTVDPLAPKLYLYIQMQLCRQDSLKDWLNANTLSRDRRELLDIFDQIVSAVDYIHDKGLMHRDLKPSNILFSMDGSVKVGDFGLVTTQEDHHLHTPATRTPQHTAQHTGQVGTRLYMSPEQAKGQTYNQKVDIYSLGLILFELFYPFVTQMERVKTLLEVRQGCLPPRFTRELPDESVFVRSLLDINPERRPTTKEIQHNPLLHDFEAARQTISRVRPRTRTTSSSGSGNSLSSSH